MMTNSADLEVLGSFILLIYMTMGYESILLFSNLCWLYVSTVEQRETNLDYILLYRLQSYLSEKHLPIFITYILADSAVQSDHIY